VFRDRAGLELRLRLRLQLVAVLVKVSVFSRAAGSTVQRPRRSFVIARMRVSIAAPFLRSLPTMPPFHFWRRRQGPHSYGQGRILTECLRTPWHHVIRCPTARSAAAVPTVPHGHRRAWGGAPLALCPLLPLSCSQLTTPKNSAGLRKVRRGAAYRKNPGERFELAT
jgi:hypothetical protein